MKNKRGVKENEERQPHKRGYNPRHGDNRSPRDSDSLRTPRNIPLNRYPEMTLTFGFLLLATISLGLVGVVYLSFKFYIFLAPLWGFLLYLAVVAVCWLGHKFHI